MNSSRIVRNLVIVLVLVSNIGCDQMSKNIVRKTLHYHQQIKLFDNHVMLTRVENSGAFLSIGDSLSLPVKFVVLILVPFTALLVGIFFLFSRSSLSRSTLFALSFIVGGGFGNIYDRYIYGSVTDFMHVDFVVFRTGIFNMADVSIMVGVFIILGSALLRKNHRQLDSESEATV
jgi:signal peptidase II